MERLEVRPALQNLENRPAVSPSRPPRRRLIVNADDFGASASINQAVLDTFQNGILTTASLMAGGEAFDDAVALARQHPRLGVGLHLTLVHGRPCLPTDHIPGLVEADGRFSNREAMAGFEFFFRPALRAQIRAELEAQFQRFHSTGLAFDHVNGHLHFHLHPAVLPIVLELCQQYGIGRLRMPRDPLAIDWRISTGRLAYRLSHAFIFKALCRWAARRLHGRGCLSPDHVFGLLRNGRVDEDYLLALIPKLPPGDSELYSHPCLRHFKKEAAALVSPAVRQSIQKEGIELITYQEL